MLKKVINVLIGDLDEKREYKQMHKSVEILPKEYKVAFKSINKYINTVGGSGNKIEIDRNMEMLTGTVELFETGAAEGRLVSDVIGNDAAKFCDELLHMYDIETETYADKLNKEIWERLYREKE